MKKIIFVVLFLLLAATVAAEKNNKEVVVFYGLNRVVYLPVESGSTSAATIGKWLQRNEECGVKYFVERIFSPANISKTPVVGVTYTVVYVTK